MKPTLALIASIALISCHVTPKQAKDRKNERPVIKANSTTVDIKDNDRLAEKAWRISPETNPDVYLTSAKKVTFYTDIDSISFHVKPGDTCNFVILLNGRDSAHTQIQCQPSYLSKLKKARKYNEKDNRYVPEFTYLPMTDPNLERLRRRFNLDSIAGTGNETSKMINLMYWVHGIVRHDGSSFNPASKNASDLIDTCRIQNRGINCRMMATLLNECYLAMGMKSRFVTCMPKETEFLDCHVINMVYSHELEKWVWMDPTFCAYVMDEKGELLGLSEVRERLIDGRPLILNPDANWNKQTSQTKEDYLESYMAKNLYRMQCPMVSQYDTETFREGKRIAYVELLPLDGIVQEPQQGESERNKMIYINYKTNNPGVFWAKPE